MSKSKSGSKKLRLNPILKKDLRVIARNMKFSWGLFAFEAVLGVIFLFAMLIMYEEVGYTNMYSSMVALFPIIGGTELVIVALITPILTASAITSEKEKQTFDILLTTVMTPHAIIRGKLLSAVTRVMMFVVGSIPLMAISFTVGGVGWWALFAFLLLTLVFAIYMGSIGIMSSTFSNKSLVSIIISYVIYGLLSGGTFIPIISISGIMGMSPEILSAISLLFNPLITFITFFVTVLGGEFIEDIFSSLAFVTAWGWIILSIVMMIVASIVMQAIAASRINPVVGYRKKMKKKNRSNNVNNVNMAGRPMPQPAMVGGGMAGVGMAQPGMQMNMQNGPMMQGQQNQSMFQGQPMQQNQPMFQSAPMQQGQPMQQSVPMQQNQFAAQNGMPQGSAPMGMQNQTSFQSEPVQPSRPVTEDHSIFQRPADQQSTPESAVTQPGNPIQAEVQSVPVTPLQTEVQSTPVTPIQLEVQSAPVTPIQAEVQSTPVSQSQSEVQSAPVVQSQSEVQSAPVIQEQREVQSQPVQPEPVVTTGTTTEGEN
ncbi:MAG: hypothetical protein J6N47_01915 [Lachnospiraceae bacterium]|nr:hypothetical protein [Lachnospiraceae bacterium]